MIPLSKPTIEQDEIDAVTEVLKSGWLVHGPKNTEFEDGIAKYIGVKRAVTVNSCASALYIAFLAHGGKVGDEAIMPSFTFPATANGAQACGVKPIFVDIDSSTFNIDPNKIEEKITKKTRFIVPVHTGGLGCDMKAIMEIAQKHDLIVVEDNAQSMGSETDGKKFGSFGTGCFSFFPTKNITTGEGGAVTTNDEELANKIKVMAAHGIDKSTFDRNTGKFVARVQRVLGFNFRLTNFQAAMGIVQLKKLDAFNQKRADVASKITKFLSGFGFITPQKKPKGYKHVYHNYIIKLNGMDRDILMNKLIEKGVGTTKYCDPPVHQQPFYEELYGAQKLPITEDVSKNNLLLPIYPSLTDQELSEMFRILEDCFKDLKK